MIDPSLRKYVDDFKRLDVYNVNTLKFFKAKDIDKFSVAVSTVQKRMIMNAVAKSEPIFSIHILR